MRCTPSIVSLYLIYVRQLELYALPRTKQLNGEREDSLKLGSWLAESDAINVPYPIKRTSALFREHMSIVSQLGGRSIHGIPVYAKSALRKKR